MKVGGYISGVSWHVQCVQCVQRTRPTDLADPLGYPDETATGRWLCLLAANRPGFCGINQNFIQ